MIVCDKCRGTKKCQPCRGYGITVLETESDLSDTNSKPTLIKCKVCGGDGQCQSCAKQVVADQPT